MLRDKLSYVAGIIDGEGCFYVAYSTNKDGYTQRQAQIIVTNTSVSLMEWLKANFDGTISLSNHSNPKHKQSYRWILTGKKAISLAEEIRPLLIVKNNEVDKLYKMRAQFLACAPLSN